MLMRSPFARIASMCAGHWSMRVTSQPALMRSAAVQLPLAPAPSTAIFLFILASSPPSAWHGLYYRGPRAREMSHAHSGRGMRRRRIRRAHTARHTNRKSHTADSGLSCKGRLVSLDQLSAPSSAIESLARARDGRVRVLGIGSTTRMPELRDRALAYLARHDHIAAHHARELAAATLRRPRSRIVRIVFPASEETNNGCTSLRSD